MTTPASQRVDVDRRQLVYPSLEDVAVVVDLDEFTPVAAARWALERKLLTHPRHQLGPRNPRSVMGTGVFMSVAAAFRGMSAVRVPACRGIPPRADIPDRQSGDGPPQRVIRREDAVIPMPVLARLRDQIRKPVEELERREL